MKVLEARQRITTLETAVKGCEQFDASLAECQAWCDHVQVILSCRAANDITAFDVPHEYQIAFASSSLVSQLQAEFDDFERCIESLRDFVLKAKDEWGGSNRFQLQLNHLIDQRDQLVNSFNEFKQPIRLEEKAERLSREVIEIENTLDELTGLNANECAEALGTAKHLQRRIVQANTDLCELAVCKTNLQQSRVMTITNVDDLTSRLNATADKLEALKQRSTEVIERLEKCIGLIQSLEKELTNLDIVVDDVETKLKTFEGKTVSDISPTDRVRLDEMQTELNKHETSLANVEKIVESLKRDSVKVDEDEIEKRWMRLRRTRGDVRGWIETLDSVSQPGTSVFAQLEAVLDEVVKKVGEMEEIDDDKRLVVELERNRSRKSMLLNRYQHLVKHDSKTASKYAERIKDVECRWNAMEEHCACMDASPVWAQPPPELPRLKLEGTLAEKIEAFHDYFNSAKDYLDFNRFPVASIRDWRKRIEDIDAWLKEHSSSLKAIVGQGRQLASSGRMELDVHDTLASLDKLVELASQVQSSVELNRALLVPVEAKAETLERDVRTMASVLLEFNDRDLTNPVTVTATERDLLDRQDQLEQLYRRSDELHRCLPGDSSNQPDSLMKGITDQLKEIEQKISRSQKETVHSKDEDEVFTSANTSVQVLPTETTASSALPDSQVQERSANDAVQVPQENSDKIMCTTSEEREDHNSLHQIYIQMDQIEEFLSNPDPFPFDEIFEKERKINDFWTVLKKAKKVIESSQMTMDIVESEASFERLNYLNEKLDARSRIVAEKLEIRKDVDENIQQCYDFLEAIDVILAELNERNQSPEIDELESVTDTLNDQLQRALAQIQHTTCKIEPLVSEMGEIEENRLRNTLRDISARWAQCETAIGEKRKRLDERMANQSELQNEIELLDFWCDEAETDCATNVNSVNVSAIGELISRIDDRLKESDEKQKNLRSIEKLKDRLVNAQAADAATKHHIRRAVSELGNRVSDVRINLADKRSVLLEMKTTANKFDSDVNSLTNFIARCKKAVEIVENAKIFTPMGAELEHVRSEEEKMESLKNSVQLRWEVALKEEAQPSETLKTKVDDLLTGWNDMMERVNKVANTLFNQESSSSLAVPDEKSEPSEVVKVDQHEASPSIPGEGATIEEAHTEELGSLNESISPQEPQLPKLSKKEQQLMNELIILKHWLAETERDASLTVDLVDIKSICDSLSMMQNWIDQMRLRHADIVNILDESRETVVREKAELMLGDWDRILGQCQRRTDKLTKMLEDCRILDQLRSNVELWLTECQERLDSGGKASESSEKVLRIQLAEVEEMTDKLEEMKTKMADVNARSNALLDEYRADEGHNLSHVTSKLNTLWSKFNDNVRIRRAVLEAALRARSDFQSALEQLEQWMERIDVNISELDANTSNTQTLKDTVRRNDWMEAEKAIRAEIDAHEDVVRSVEDMGRQFFRKLEDTRERDRLNERIATVDDRWRRMKKTDTQIRERLNMAQEEWERLLSQLSEMTFWVDTQRKALNAEHPVGGSLARLQQQNKFIEDLRRELEQRQKSTDECIMLANSYLMQHDLRPRMHTVGVLDSDSFETNDPAKIELRRIGIQIKADSEKLKKKWDDLKEQLTAWSELVSDAHSKMLELDNALAECQLALSTLETVLDGMTPVEKLRLEELVGAVAENEKIKERIARTRIHIDDANDWSGRLLASDVDLEAEPSAQLKSVNDRFNQLKLKVRVRVAALDHAMTDFGPSSQHFLMNSVHLPWQRAVSATNHLPYYINHETELTQWDHPAMIEIMEELNSFNQVKFSAYRTAMKLRAIQKRLCLDLIGLDDLDAQFSQMSPGELNVTVQDAVVCLVPLFEKAQSKYPNLIRSMPLAVDLVLNFLLNIYDPARDGILRTLSFKVALVVLCSANLEDKYKYLFRLIASADGVDQKNLALLLYDIIHLPKLLGEAAAFGGSNVEPSVRSCFESVNFERTITLNALLAWLKKEPQSIVWLPVLHRLASAEFAKHQAKCNICKMFPIIGLRYRCLQCFNVDLCQNCFFSQRLAKNHKLTHPIQEYCLPTTSGEDVRDFGRMIRNKFRSRSRSRIGYLPVQTVDEGKPIVSSTSIPMNPETEPIHNRIHMCSQRLLRARGGDNSPPPLKSEESEEMPKNNTVELKSPQQLMSQVEQMHKEELDQVLLKLQRENKLLKKEVARRKRLEVNGSTPNLMRSMVKEVDRATMMAIGRSVPSLQHTADEQMLHEAQLLRQHKERLEQRSKILEEQNRQLEVQLSRLRAVIAQQQSTSRECSNEKDRRDESEPSGVSGEEDEGIEYDARPNRMHSLIASVDQLGRAMQSFVVSVVQDDEDSDEEEENTIVVNQ